MNTLLTIVWDVDPEAFTIPFTNWPVRWYGILFVIGLLVAQYLLIYIFEKDGKTRKNVEDLTIYVVLGTIIGARLGHVFFYDAPYYLSHPAEILQIWKGGLASHGGAIGILIAVYLYSRKSKINALWIFDRLVIVACFTGASIRFGNLMNSEIIGKITTLPWGVKFVRAYPPEMALDFRHPAQVYEALYFLVLLGVLFYIWKKYSHKLNNGYMFGLFLVILFTLRFIDEFFKVSQEAWEDDMLLNMGQILSIPFVIAGIYLIYQAKSKPVKTS